jgi:hypothetical protein
VPQPNRPIIDIFVHAYRHRILVLRLLRLHGKAFEAVTLKNPESAVGADEIEPCAGGLRVGAPATMAAP